MCILLNNTRMLQHHQHKLGQAMYQHVSPPFAFLAPLNLRFAGHASKPKKSLSVSFETEH
jgi:hypothetical protein